MPENRPLIQLEQNATAPVLRYDIPEPTSYDGINLIQLTLEDGDSVFKPELLQAPKSEALTILESQPSDTVKSQINSFLNFGASGSPAFGISPGLSVRPDQPHLPTPPEPLPLPPGGTGLPGSDLVLSDLAQRVKAGERIVVDENINGDQSVTTVPVPADPEPHLYLVETLRMTSFLGDYGAGRVVKTFTLLPGESTKVSIKTYRQRESTSKKSSSVLDSVSTESADDFQKSLQEEQSNQTEFQKSKEYYADVKAKARWGWGSASAKAGIKGASNSVRQEAIKNISNATEKHSSKASAKREVEVNTAFEVSEKEGEERSIEREIQNINVSRTLNFVFRQMNQAFITFVHQTDLRIAYFDGRRESRIEVSISQLDTLLKKVVIAAKVDDVRDAIMDQISSIRDNEGNAVNVVKNVEVGQNDSYNIFDPDLSTDFNDPSTGRTYRIPGVLHAVNRHVMRTEGVIVESILGEGAALDEYAIALQETEIKRRLEEVRMMKIKGDQAALVATFSKNGSQDEAKILRSLLCPCDHNGATHSDTDT